MNKKTKAIICSQSDFATDYRIHKMADTLRASGYDVDFVGRSHPAQDRKESADTHIMKLVTWRGFLFYAELNIRLLMHLLFGRRYDLVVAIDLDTLPACTLASALRRETLMFDSHEYFPEVPEIANKPLTKWVWNTFQDLCVPHTDIRVTVCQSIADIFRQKYGKDFLVVRNVPLAERALSISRDEVPNNRPFTILYQGAVNVGRGIEETLQAMVEIPNLHFLVVGDGDKMQDVRNLANQLGVDDRVEFTGRKPFGELGQYMSRADLGIVFMRNISLNYYLSLPNRTFDFISAGVPMLGIDFPEIARIVKGYDVGLCIPEMTVEAVRDAIRSVMDHPEWCARWKNNMARLAPTLTWECETQALQKVLTEK